MQTGDCEDQLLPPRPKFDQFKQSSNGEASFRVYYGGAAGSVPFTWETRPGTPKHPLFEEDSLLPPLTPPPSYLSTPKINIKNSKSKIFDFNFFSKSKSTNGEKGLFSSASVSSTSVPTSRNNNLYARSGNRWSRSIVHYSFNEDESEKTPAKSNVPALCFGGSGNRSGGNGGGGNLGMFRRVKNVKKKIRLIVGGNGTV